MIRSKSHYKYFNKLDRETMLIQDTLKRPRLFRDDHWRFVRLMRKTEYYNNCRTDFFGKLYCKFLKLKFVNYSRKLNFSIPINTIDAGAGIFHYGTIIVNDTAKIGKEVHLHCHTNIAANVIIGNNVYIGPGAKILNDVVIADGIRIGANAVVNKSFLEPNITIAGVPAKKVSEKGMLEYTP